MTLATQSIMAMTFTPPLIVLALLVYADIREALKGTDTSSANTDDFVIIDGVA